MRNAAKSKTVRRTLKRCKYCGARTRRTGESYTWRKLGCPIGVVLVRACPRCLRRSTERHREDPPDTPLVENDR